jgi:hypothetical protein
VVSLETVRVPKRSIDRKRGGSRRHNRKGELRCEVDRW